MPSWVSEHSQPIRKRNLFEKRLRRLRAAVKDHKDLRHIGIEAEKTRRAGLSLIKAKLVLIKEYPGRDPDGRQTRNLKIEEDRLTSLSTESIVEEYGGVDARNPCSQSDC